MGSLASLIRSGQIWRATLESRAINTEGLSPLKRCLQTECKNIFEECFEQFAVGERKQIVRSDIPEIDQALPDGGLRFGTTHEWILESSLPLRSQYPYTISAWWAAQSFLSQEPKVAGRGITGEARFIFWIGRETWPSPHVLMEMISNIDASKNDEIVAQAFLQRNIFLDVHGEKEQLWAAETALRSGGAALVVAPLKDNSRIATSRLRIAAEKGETLGFFLRNHKTSGPNVTREMYSGRSAAQSQWLLQPWLLQPQEHLQSEYALGSCKTIDSAESEKFSSTSIISKLSGSSRSNRNVREIIPRWRLSLLKWRGIMPSTREWQVELKRPSIHDLYFSSSTLGKGMNGEMSGGPVKQRTSEGYRESNKLKLETRALSLCVSPILVDRTTHYQPENPQRRNEPNQHRQEASPRVSNG